MVVRVCVLKAKHFLPLGNLLDNTWQHVPQRTLADVGGTEEASQSSSNDACSEHILSS